MPTFREVRNVSGMSATQLRDLGFKSGSSATLAETLQRLKCPMFWEQWSTQARQAWSSALGFPDMNPDEAWRAWWKAGDEVLDVPTHAAHRARHELAIEATRTQLILDLVVPHG